MNKATVKKKAKRLVLTCGILGLMIFTGVGNTAAQPLQPMVTYASEQNQSLPYSSRWEIMSNGDWKYKMDNGQYATGKWLQDEVDKNWYLMNENGIMRSGIYKSYGKYYLLSEIHDGHYGHLVKNGEVYNGVAIKASTNADDEGALSSETINALKSLGYNIDTVQDVSGTSHVTDGKVSLNADVENESLNSESNNTEPEKNYSEDTNEYGTDGFYDPIFGWVDTSGIETIGHGNKTNTKWE